MRTDTSAYGSIADGIGPSERSWLVAWRTAKYSFVWLISLLCVMWFGVPVNGWAIVAGIVGYLSGLVMLGRRVRRFLA